TRFRHRHRIMRGDRGSSAEQILDQGERWRLTHVVGVGLERQSPDRNPTPAQLRPDRLLKLLEESVLLVVVHRLHGLENAETRAVVARGADERLDVFREAGSAIARAWKEKRGPDSRITSDALPNEVDV